MAFKKLTDYNEAKYGGLFVLRDDGDWADVVFLYQDVSDVLVANVHYINSSNYTGYVHCCEAGCPACAKGIKVQTKLFIPVYNITAGEVQFWDRSVRFETQLQRNVFSHPANPSEYVFRVTRHGVARSMDTTYEIRATYKNTPEFSYETILNTNNITFPEYYDHIVKEFSPYDIDNMINVKSSVPSDTVQLPNYKITPRGITPVETPTIGTTTGEPVNLPDISTTASVDEDYTEEVDDNISPF